MGRNAIGGLLVFVYTSSYTVSLYIQIQYNLVSRTPGDLIQYNLVSRTPGDLIQYTLVSKNTVNTYTVSIPFKAFNT